MRWVVGLSCAGLLGLADLARAAPGQTVEAIVARVLEQDARVTEIKNRFRYDLRLVNAKLAADDSVIREELVEATIEPGSDGAFREIVERAQGDELSAQDRKEIRRSQGAMRSMDLRRLAPRFRIELEGEGREMGVDCWILAFAPKPDQPYRSREEKVINQLAGRFWVAKADYSIVRSSGSLTRPVKVAWVFATVRDLQFEYRTTPLGRVGRVPEVFDLFFDVKTPVNEVRRRQISTMGNYREL